MTMAAAGDELPAQPGGAKALLLTILGEFVLPAGGEAWTSTLVDAAAALDIGEKNARQAISRLGDQGVIVAGRHGRRVRWSLSPTGRELLEVGTERIYAFGRGGHGWSGAWLVAHSPVAEAQRSSRTQLRTRLGFLGFGELSASLLVSPHVDREPELRAVLDELGLTLDSTILRSTTGSPAEDAELVARSWDVQGLAVAYTAFVDEQSARDPRGEEASFRAVVELVHDWRRFPFIDPELPTELLPDPWAGATAAALFHDCHARWSPAARRWYDGRRPADAAGVTAPRG